MAKDRSHPRNAQMLGLVRDGRTPTACGLCGTVTKMTRAHIPPQCAGNDGLVARVRPTSMGAERRTRLGKPRRGGLYVFGHCVSCNGIASAYDSAYGELVWALRPLWPRNPSVQTPHRVALPDVLVRPGAVARSLLMGMCAVNPNIRTTHPGLAADLHHVRATSLPEDLRLRVALYRSNRARISGAIGGMILVGPYSRPRINGMAPGVMYAAAVFFPPLAWVLTHDRESLLDRQGFADASPWLAYEPTELKALGSLLPQLPYVHYPQHDPVIGTWWTEMFSDEITEIVETDYLPPSVLRST